MGNDPEKEKSHHKRHDGHDGSMAASDDIRDVHHMTDKELEQWEAQHGKKKDPHEEKDIAARVINIEVVGDKCKVGFGVDPKKVHNGMTVLLMRGEALMAMSGLVVDAANHYAYGFVDLTPDMIHSATKAVINPSSIPKSASPHDDIKARIVGVSVVGGTKTQILIGMGTSHGIRAGMQGYCMDDGGKYHVGSRFHVTEAGSMTSKAIVEMSVDEVYHLSGNKLVMVNPKHMP